jgi:hypothetical protein
VLLQAASITADSVDGKEALDQRTHDFEEADATRQSILTAVSAHDHDRTGQSAGLPSDSTETNAEAKW